MTHGFHSSYTDTSKPSRNHRIQSFVHRQSSIILAGTGWPGQPAAVAWKGGWPLSRQHCDGWQVAGPYNGAGPSSAKGLPLRSLLRASRLLALLGLITQAEVSSPNQPPIPHLSCLHSPVSPTWGGAHCDPGTEGNRSRSSHGSCWV